jgi:hypothetical protein
MTIAARQYIVGDELDLSDEAGNQSISGPRQATNGPCSIFAGNAAASRSYAAAII